VLAGAIYGHAGRYARHFRTSGADGSGNCGEHGALVGLDRKSNGRHGGGDDQLGRNISASSAMAARAIANHGTYGTSLGAACMEVSVKTFIQIVQMLPAIITAVKELESFVPVSGAGKAKLDFIVGVISDTVSDASSVIEPITKVVARLVALANSTGIFRK
jgi:hypothetical protein